MEVRGRPQVSTLPVIISQSPSLTKECGSLKRTEITVTSTWSQNLPLALYICQAPARQSCFGLCGLSLAPPFTTLFINKITFPFLIYYKVGSLTVKLSLPTLEPRLPKHYVQNYLL